MRRSAWMSQTSVWRLKHHRRRKIHLGDCDLHTAMICHIIIALCDTRYIVYSRLNLHRVPYMAYKVVYMRVSYNDGGYSFHPLCSLLKCATDDISSIISKDRKIGKALLQTYEFITYQIWDNSIYFVCQFTAISLMMVIWFGNHPA